MGSEAGGLYPFAGYWSNADGNSQLVFRPYASWANAPENFSAAFGESASNGRKFLARQAPEWQRSVSDAEREWLLAGNSLVSVRLGRRFAAGFFIRYPLVRQKQASEINVEWLTKILSN